MRFTRFLDEESGFSFSVFFFFFPHEGTYIVDTFFFLSLSRAFLFYIILSYSTVRETLYTKYVS